MVQDLKSIIDHLNTANTQQQDNEDPVRTSVTLDMLQWYQSKNSALNLESVFLFSKSFPYESFRFDLKQRDYTKTLITSSVVCTFGVNILRSLIQVRETFYTLTE